MRRRRGPKLDPFARAENPTSPMAEFVISCAEEVPYLDAVREYQEEWCEHPKWEVLVTRSTTSHNGDHHALACVECGKVKYKNGKARVSVGR